MREFRALLRIETLMLARDPAFLVSTLLVAVLSIFIFGYLFTGEPDDFPLGVADADGSPASREVVRAFRDVEGIELSEGTEGEELEALRDGDRWAIIVIPSGFQQGVAAGGASVEVYYNATSLAAATAGRSTVQSIVADINYSLADREPLVTIVEESLSARRLGMIDFIGPGMVGLAIMFGSIGTGQFLVAWRQQGILRRLGVTPLRPWLLIASQMVSLLLLSALSAAIILSLAWLLFGLSVHGSFLALAVVVLSGSLCMLGIGYFIGSRARTAVAASTIVNLITLPMLFLGGSYFPTDSAPQFLIPLVRFVPLTYLNDALRAVINDGEGLRAIWLDLVVLAAWTTATVSLSSRIFRWQ